ncbi:unnamed protein product [marine sediment metagenome]|uniref:Uncharacterized protein n=1 Tax=marine sediment metagenome TaxID=412755 RepID=X0U6V0_9ZZZZ
MRYSLDFVIPAGTTKAAPHTEIMYLTVGLLNKILVRFRAGCHNMVSIAVLDGLHQILPASQDLAIYGDSVTFDIPMKHYMSTKPYSVTLIGWSPLCLYDHIITFWFDLAEGETLAKQEFAEMMAHLGSKP